MYMGLEKKLVQVSVVFPIFHDRQFTRLFEFYDLYILCNGRRMTSVKVGVVEVGLLIVVVWE